jgi:LCP family protein required for cell wall assembly
MRFNPFKRSSDPFSAARWDGTVRGYAERKRRRKHMRRWWQWGLVALVLVIAGVAGWATWLYYHTQGKIQTEIQGVQGKDDELDPFNALLVGSDSRRGLSEKEQLDLGANAVPGQRADTLILAHVDPRADLITMVQFPRDLYVPVGGGREDRINSALETGPNTVVRTIRELTGLQINQYVQVNIAGFRDLVDAIGGVELCVTEPIPFDRQTGIEITEEELGMIEFDGDRAIRFVRSRHFASGDFERIRNQQRFLAAAIDKVTSISTFLNPSRITRLARVAGDNLETDQHTTINGLRELAQKMRSFDPEHYEAYIAPNLGVATVDGASVVLPDVRAMNLLFDAVAGNESPAEADDVPDVEPSTIRVGVYNGTFEAGAAAKAAAKLKQATTTMSGPVKVVDVANADRLRYRRTVVRYAPEARAMAELIAGVIPGAELTEAETDDDVDVEVIVGRRFRTRRIVQVVPIPIPEPSATPRICRR